MPCLTERSPERAVACPRARMGVMAEAGPPPRLLVPDSGPLSVTPRDESRKMLPGSQTKEAWRSRGPPDPASSTTHASVLRRESPSLFYPTRRTPPFSPHRQPPRCFSVPAGPDHSPNHTPMAPKWSLPWRFPEPGLGAVLLEATPKLSEPSCLLGSA